MTGNYLNKTRRQSRVGFYCALRTGLKNSLLLLLVAGFSAEAFAQAGTISAVPQVLSPDAVALGKFVEVPVSNYSGLPEISIPIYTLKAKSMNVPVSLSYHASGVKVKEFPGWVGANFAMNFGGTITRIVRGEPDYFGPGFPGYFLQNAAHMNEPGYTTPDRRMMSGIVSEQYGNEKIDLQFDIYYFNVMGHTGRFTFDNDGNVMMLDVTDVKITGGGGFTMTDAQGNVYDFGIADSYQWLDRYAYDNTWYLTSVHIPDQEETINFNYKKYDNWRLYRYPNGPESRTDRELFQDVFPPQGVVQNPACENAGYSNSADLSLGQTCVLQSVVYKSDSIKFYHDTSRADVYKVRLDSIRVFQGAVPVHTSRLTYSFINSGSSDPRDKKMLLSSVQSNDQPAYTMDYYSSFNSKSMPGPYVWGTDLWGYYNGQLYDMSTPVTAPRDPDYRYGQLGSLHTLSYPTGGNTEFIYEGNDFSYCQNVLDSIGPIYHAGGLRIKKIRFNSPVSSSSFEKTYEYTHGAKSSGVLEGLFANLSSMLHWGEGREFIPSPYCWNVNWPQVCIFLMRSADNVVPLGNAQGGAIGYAQVTERLSDGSKKVMQFTNGGFDPYTYYPLFDPLLDGYADGYNNDYLGSQVIQDRVTYDYSSYRGKLKNVAYYNSSGQKIKQEVHRFSNLITDRLPFNDQPRSTNRYLAPGQVSGYGSGVCDYPPAYGTTWSGYWHLQRNVVPVLDSAYTFIGTDTLKEVVKYDYNSPFRSSPSRIIKVGTKGDSTITHYKYPYDAFGSGAIAAGAGNLVLVNKVDQPLESWVEKKDVGGGNARTVSAQGAAFKPFTPVPQTVYALNNTAGLTDFSPGTTDSRYLATLKFQRYDNQRNVTEQGKDGQEKEVLVWGYSHRLLVARVSGSDYASVIALVDTTVLNNPASDAVLRTELQKIRSGLAGTNVKAKVTTYTYATLTGLTSMTDPRGETTYYEYDDFGRMKRRKDHDGALKENLWYHYKP